jgi:hypothetical protein
MDESYMATNHLYQPLNDMLMGRNLKLRWQSFHGTVCRGETVRAPTKIQSGVS